MAGTQNLQNTALQHQQPLEDSDEGESQPPIKEDFTRAPNSQSDEKINATDPFDQTSSPTESPVDQIENMTREAGDGQNDNGSEQIE